MEKKPNNGLMWVVAAGILVAAIVGVVYVLMNDNKDDDATQATDLPARQETPESSGSNQSAKPNEVGTGTTIVFTDDGFKPSEYTSKVNQPVTVKNESSRDLQFSSDNHPSHTDAPELNMGVLTPGKSGTFTPTDAGTYGFHDHLNDQFTGTIVIS